MDLHLTKLGQTVVTTSLGQWTGWPLYQFSGCSDTAQIVIQCP